LDGSILQKNGGRRWIQWSSTPLRDFAGRVTGFASLGEDVTELRTLRAEAARREGEERFRDMADTAPVMIWVSGPDKLCIFFNKPWLDFTGSTMDQAVGNGWIERVHPEDRDRCYTNYSSAFEAHRTFQAECRVRRRDGEYRWMLATGAPRFESSGAFVGYVGSCTDITDVKRAQQEALARQKLESLGVLAGGIAHDFNNLLGSIVANSELVLSELPGGSPAYEGVESIRNVACHAAEIVGQMMAYAGQESTVFEPVDLSGLLHEMLEFLKVSISKRTTLNVSLLEKLPTVRANAAQLRQVVLNLITNASEALGDQEGIISFAVTQVQSAHGKTIAARHARVHAPVLGVKNQELWLDTDRSSNPRWAVLNGQGRQIIKLQRLAHCNGDDQKAAQCTSDLPPEEKKAQANGGDRDHMHEFRV
jgi:PAS domain S-box-containing protein